MDNPSAIRGTLIQYFPGVEWETPTFPAVQTWDGWKNADVAVLARPDRPVKRASRVVAAEGAHPFTNRNWELGRLPPELEGLAMRPGEIETTVFVCEEPGVVFLLVPEADGPYRNYFVERAAEQGFRLTGLPDVSISTGDGKINTRVMAREVGPPRVWAFGFWGIALFR